jgi:hypothetical protein
MWGRQYSVHSSGALGVASGAARRALPGKWASGWRQCKQNDWSRPEVPCPMVGYPLACVVNMTVALNRGGKRSDNYE